MKYLIVLLVLTHILYAQKVEISADNFAADEKKMLSILTGHVTLKKGEDLIKASKITIYFDKSNKPKEYVAQGHITFSIHTKTQDFEGRAQTLRYDPSTLIYEMSGDAFIHDKNQDRKLYGEHIMIDRISGKSIIKGGVKKPVKFIFSVKE